jgi:hypothetical protein
MNELNDIGIRDNFNNIEKIRIFFLYLIIFGKIKICKFSKDWRILHNENNVVKDLMNAF